MYPSTYNPPIFLSLDSVCSFWSVKKKVIYHIETADAVKIQLPLPSLPQFRNFSFLVLNFINALVVLHLYCCIVLYVLLLRLLLFLTGCCEITWPPISYIFQLRHSKCFPWNYYPSTCIYIISTLFYFTEESPSNYCLSTCFSHVIDTTHLSFTWDPEFHLILLLKPNERQDIVILS
jgi:hypothetical protein